MHLLELVNTSYVQLRAGWPAELALKLLAESSVTHVIVYCEEPDLTQPTDDSKADRSGDVEPTEVVRRFYLYRKQIALETLKTNASARTVAAAFELSDIPDTPVLDAYVQADLAPDQVVIADEGRLLGFFDADVRPAGKTRSAESATDKAEPRLLTADFPDELPLNEKRSLLVTLAELSEESTPGLGANLADLAIGTSLTIIVQPRRGLELVGGVGEATFVVTAKEEVRQFELRAVQPGAAELRVLAFNGGQEIASIKLKPTIAAMDRPVGSARSTEVRPIGLTQGSEPDLSLLILEDTSGGNLMLTFRLKALDPNLGLNYKQYGPITIKSSPTEYFRIFFDEIEKLPLANETDRKVAQRKLEAKGGELFRKLLPEPLQKELWSCRQSIKSVLVQSDEPWIPWELCKLECDEDGKVQTGPFFCEAFEITRWLLGVPMKPELHVTNMALVLPKNSGLPFAAQERDYLLSLDDPPRRSVKRLPATFLTVANALINGGHDAWHFTGHGGYCNADPSYAAMLLEDGTQLTPQDLNGELRNMGTGGPLVFLNACQIGRPGMSLTGIGGWASEFLNCGAGAFVGAYWSIYDKSAVAFAQALYGELLTGVPIGQAAKDARMKIKSEGDSTWLSYTVWASPTAKVVR